MMPLLGALLQDPFEVPWQIVPAAIFTPNCAGYSSPSSSSDSVSGSLISPVSRRHASSRRSFERNFPERAELETVPDPSLIGAEILLESAA